MVTGHFDASPWPDQPHILSVVERHAAIFFFEGWAGISPTVHNLLRALDRAGYAAHVLATRNPHPEPDDLGPNIKMDYVRRPGRTRGDGPVRRTLPFRLDFLIPVVDLAWYGLAYLWRLLSKDYPGWRRGPGIGIDTRGSIVALLRRRLTGAKFVYLSLELEEAKEFRRAAGVIRHLERLAYREAEWVIIQDKERFATLSSYLAYDHPQVIYLPNSPSGSADSATTPNERFLRQRLAISEEEFPLIALHAGMIDPLVMSMELARTFASVDRGCALVLHEHQRRQPGDPYVEGLRKANGRNLFLSLEPVPPSQLDDLFVSASIGLAFYRDESPNFSDIAMASGKIGFYLKHGKPILVNALPSLERFVSTHEVGVVIRDPNDPSEMEAAIDTIMGDYERFSGNARRCFERELDFDRFVGPVLDVLDRL